MRLFQGQRAWMLQRLTAVVVLALLALCVALVLVGPPLSFARWHALATSPHGAVLIVVFFAAMGLHAWIGIRDVVLDYVHPPAIRLALLTVIAVILTAIVTRVALTMAAHFAAAS